MHKGSARHLGGDSQVIVHCEYIAGRNKSHFSFERENVCEQEKHENKNVPPWPPAPAPKNNKNNEIYTNKNKYFV